MRFHRSAALLAAFCFVFAACSGSGDRSLPLSGVRSAESRIQASITRSSAQPQYAPGIPNIFAAAQNLRLADPAFDSYIDAKVQGAAERWRAN